MTDHGGSVGPGEAINAVADLHRTGEVAVIRIDSPPVNALSHVVRAGIVAALDRLKSAGGVRAAVLACSGRTFFVGADISELNGPERSPSFAEMIEAVESAPFPVIAAIHGSALGGGLELALACHGRVALASARLGLPEVRLGLLPGAGGTQRLPRLVGPERALDLMVTGQHQPASEALADGLLDAVFPGKTAADIEAAAIRHAAALPPASGRRVRDRDDLLAEARQQMPGFLREWRDRNARHFRGETAPDRILACVGAALTRSFDEGLAVERQQFAECLADPQSAALRHVFRAERLARRPARLKNVAPLPLARIGVVGAGTMGRGIAMAIAAAGLPVVLSDARPEALAAGHEAVLQSLSRLVARGRLTTAEAEAQLTRILPSTDDHALADCDLIVEAVFEDMAVKLAVFDRLDRIARPGAILATNTSYLDVNRLAQATTRPGRVLGMHFFAPAHLMRLVEVVAGASSDDETVATAFDLVQRMGKQPVLSGVCHGFIGNRMLEKRQDEALRLVLEGATPEAVDRVATDFGFPMGPFAMHDLAGLDLGWSAETSHGETLRDILCEAGRRGQKTGAGFFDYGPDRKPKVSAEVAAMIRGFAERQGILPRQLCDSEVHDRMLLPMIDEGATILDEGITDRASDIDVVWIHGYGWPAHTGGPMYWAAAQGLCRIVERLEALSDACGERFAPSEPLRRAAQAGGWGGDRPAAPPAGGQNRPSNSPVA